VRHAGEGDPEQLGLLGRQVGVVANDLGDRVGALLGDAVDALADGGLVGQVGLEVEA
jgi:hypothetical protein